MKFHLFISRIFHFFLKRRYRVIIKGAEILEYKGAKLILPNHPAQMDAQLLGVITNKYWDIVPVVSERFVEMRFVGFFMRRMRAIPVSDLAAGNRDPDVLKKVLSGVMAAFDEKRSVIIYPAGSITSTAEEKIGNKQSAYSVVSNLPVDVAIIGVRIRGLWGSIWSVAWKEEKPKFGLTFLKSVFYVFANFIFLLPKRNVSIEFVDITKEAKEEVKADRRSFNKYLEAFYNSQGPENVSYVRHFFFLPIKKSKRQQN